MRVARVAYDPANLLHGGPTRRSTSCATTSSGSNDAIAALGGNPYGNRGRWYFGSSNDLRLNLRVRRYDAAPAALAAMAPYETNGDLSIPLVTIHTTADEVAPFAHELLYLPKVDTHGPRPLPAVPDRALRPLQLHGDRDRPGVPVHGEPALGGARLAGGGSDGSRLRDRRRL